MADLIYYGLLGGGMFLFSWICIRQFGRGRKTGDPFGGPLSNEWSPPPEPAPPPPKRRLRLVKPHKNTPWNRLYRRLHGEQYEWRQE